MSRDRPWTPTDRELVAQAIRTAQEERYGCHLTADAVLDVLADAGRYTPERDDGATVDEMARWWDATADHRASLLDWRTDA